MGSNYYIFKSSGINKTCIIVHNDLLLLFAWASDLSIQVIKDGFFIFLISAIWLSHGQLWTIIEGTVSLKQYKSLCLPIFDPRFTESLFSRVPKPGQVRNGIWTGHLRFDVKAFSTSYLHGIFFESRGN